MTWIDSHVHLWTPDTDRYPLAPGGDESRMTPRDFPPEVFLRHARPSGIDRAVLVQTVNYGVDNSYMLGCVERFPSFFRMVAIVDHNSATVADEMDALLERGVTGFRILPQPGKVEGWLQEPGYDAMFRAAAGTGQAVCPMIGPDGLADLDRMCGEHPDTTVVVDHIAKISEEGPVRDEDIDSLCALARHPKVHVKISRFHALGKAKPPHDDLAPLIRRVVDTFGPERCMWGSDSPFQVVDETYEDSISLVRDRLDFLSDSDRQAILTGTAEKVYFQR